MTQNASCQMENDCLKIVVRLHGAELISLVDKEKSREYMWSGDPEYWDGISPVLFPFIGSLKDRSYIHKGKRYTQIPQHGFAKDREYKIIQKDDNTIWLEMIGQPEDKAIYPFDFLFRIGYRLEGKKLHVMWMVRNDTEEKMPFSLGGHPAFIMPNGDGKEGYYLNLYNGEDKLISGEANTSCLLIPEKRSFAMENGRLRLTDSLFDHDALIIDSEKLSMISLDTPEGKPFIKVYFDVPQLGVWSPEGDAPFVCIEPWHGRCDRVDYDGDLMHREYGLVIEPNEIYEGQYTIEIL